MNSNTDIDPAIKLRDELYPDHELATAIGFRLDVLASLIPPKGVKREQTETDEDFRKRAIDYYRSAKHAYSYQPRCAYCGCTFPCVCFGQHREAK